MSRQVSAFSTATPIRADQGSILPRAIRRVLWATTTAESHNPDSGLPEIRSTGGIAPRHAARSKRNITGEACPEPPPHYRTQQHVEQRVRPSSDKCCEP